MASKAIIVARGSPQAFKKPTGRPSKPRAFQLPIFPRAPFTSAGVTGPPAESLGVVVVVVVVVVVISVRSASGFGKNLAASNLAFPSWPVAVIDPSYRSGSLGGGGGR